MDPSYDFWNSELNRIFANLKPGDMLRLISTDNPQDQLLLPHRRPRPVRESDLWDTEKKENPKPPVDRSLTKFDREIADKKDPQD
jgi:hypothetical protein